MMVRMQRRVALLIGLALVFALEGCSLLANQAPQASFTVFPPVPLAGREALFDSTASSDPDGKLVSFQWAFGDGQRAEGPEAYHAYAQKGPYEVTLTVIDERGGRSSITQTVLVGAPIGRVRTHFKVPRLEVAAGLTWDGQVLWITDEVAGNLYRVNPQDGRVLSSLRAPGSYPQGLAWDGESLWVADASEGQLYQLDPQKGQVERSLAAPGAGMPMGLAWDGEMLWVTDWIDLRIYQVEPQTGQVLNSFRAPGDAPEALAWHEESLWVLDGIYGIFELDPESGQPLQVWAQLPGDNPRGLAWAGASLWLASDDELYQLELTSDHP
ncbi:MAG: hypothetical protein A2Z21_01025 [Candidatus Fraserbacteria bacterium RBG_16_55_9]|uniref:PKD domain-containing protein n=1 Tax=Fraserbacteria sp. (strain RBG_16_55_9) TaxID=1817864 RepID=A0A1F5URN2_FRAXR|nr:MAG: hypothetical protein A2Z21_01025 [Candidatus Fraserbacteria bacterium RBG_16_55_9]